MGYFNMKAWRNRVTQFPTRRKITIESQSATQITGAITRDEGTIADEGDALDATNLNDLEERINTAFGAVEADIGTKWAKTENTDNKVTAINSASTDTQYPSAKCVYAEVAARERTSNKVTSINNSSTDDQYPSAHAVYNYLNKMRVGGGTTTDWKNTANSNMQWYFYEGSSTSTLDLPTANCIVIVFKQSTSRGAAFAFGWAGGSTDKTVWKNTLHDSWKGWVSLHSN